MQMVSFPGLECKVGIHVRFVPWPRCPAQSLSNVCISQPFLMPAYVAEEWNTIAEGGPDFYPSHLPMALLEPQPSIASMQQG